VSGAVSSGAVSSGVPASGVPASGVTYGDSVSGVWGASSTAAGSGSVPGDLAGRRGLRGDGLFSTTGSPDMSGMYTTC